MPVRRYDSQNDSGYGSLGKTQMVAGNSTRYLLWLESQNINNISLATPGNPDVPLTYVYHILHVWKFTALNFDINAIKTYNAITEKRQFGTVVCKNRGYVTAEMNVSFADQMSAAPMITATVFKGNVSQQTSIPCDEPPSDSVFVPITGGSYQACSGYLYGSSNQSLGLTSTTKPLLADDVQFFPSVALKSYIFGAGYRYTTTVYTNTFTSTNADVVVVNQ